VSLHPTFSRDRHHRLVLPSLPSDPPTEQRRGPRFSVLRIVVAVGALVCGSVLLVQIPEFVTALVASLTHHLLLAPLGLVLVGAGILTRALQTRASSRLCGVDSWWQRDLELSATTYSTNRVVKAAGVAGVVHHLADADRHGHSRRSVTLAYATTKFSDVVAFGFLAAVTVAAAAVTGALTGATRIASFVTLAYATGQVVVLVLLARHPRAVRRIASGVPVVSKWLPRGDGADGRSTALDVTTIVDMVRDAPSTAYPCLATAVATKLVGLATFVLVLHVVVPAVDPITAAALFVLGLAAAMLGPLPGGIGTTEAALIAVLAAEGARTASVTGAVAAFRLFDFWLPTTIGFAITAWRAARQLSGATATRRAAPSLVTSPV
jgi:uncharacterized membrane protein YbhN (UPF0104 family)